MLKVCAESINQILTPVEEIPKTKLSLGPLSGPKNPTAEELALIRLYIQDIVEICNINEPRLFTVKMKALHMFQLDKMNAVLNTVAEFAQIYFD
jgi:hypothetical protein